MSGTLSDHEVAHSVVAKFDAIGIIFDAPLWPKREELSPAGQTLFDVMVGEAKHYTLAIAECRFGDAFVILGKWGKLVNSFIDDTLIGDNEHNHRLLRVFKYYADASGVGWELLKGR